MRFFSCLVGARALAREKIGVIDLMEFMPHVVNSDAPINGTFR